MKAATEDRPFLAGWFRYSRRTSLGTSVAQARSESISGPGWIMNSHQRAISTATSGPCGPRGRCPISCWSACTRTSWGASAGSRPTTTRRRGSIRPSRRTSVPRAVQGRHPKLSGRSALLGNRAAPVPFRRPASYGDRPAYAQSWLRYRLAGSGNAGLAKPELAAEILTWMRELSEPFGTTIEVASGAGRVQIPAAA